MVTKAKHTIRAEPRRLQFWHNVKCRNIQRCHMLWSCNTQSIIAYHIHLNLMMHGIMNWRLNNPINKLVYILDIFYVLYDSYNDIYIASSIFDVIQIVCTIQIWWGIQRGYVYLASYSTRKCVKPNWTLRQSEGFKILHTLYANFCPWNFQTDEQCSDFDRLYSDNFKMELYHSIWSTLYCTNFNDNLGIWEEIVLKNAKC
jgi:hypothetical protein